MVDRIRGKWVAGFPIQFAFVVVISFSLVIYLSGWVAFSRIEARTGSDYARHSRDGWSVENQNNMEEGNTIKSDTLLWERVALFVCPLH